MKLTQEQIEIYKEDGMLFLLDCFSQAEVESMRAELLSLMAEDRPGQLLEKDNKTVRALHGCHTTSPIFHRLTLHPCLLEPAKQLLANDIYIYQFKINLKAAFDGDYWPWHQDFIFWDKEDGMPSPQALNVSVFLDEVNEFNGPIYLIPGSHKESHTHIQTYPQTPIRHGEKAEWMDSFIANLKYTLDKPTITQLVEQQSIVAPKGPPGSVLFFHCNLVHGSVPNISPYNRRLVIITYNSLDNVPTFNKTSRPKFLVNQDPNPTPL